MPRKPPKTLTADEAARLCAAPNLDVPTGLRDRCMIELMLRCGLRVSEVCNLHLRDVDWRTGEIRLRAEATKGGREAKAHLDPVTLRLLERWKQTRRAFGAGRPHLFVCVRSGQRGEPVDPRRVHEMIGRRARKAGIGRHVHPHMLRHTFATDLLREGFNIQEVRKAMRHSDIRTTSIYLEVHDEQLAAKLRARAR